MCSSVFKEFSMSGMNVTPVGFQSNGFYSKPPNPVDDLVLKAEETVRRTNLQSAAKTPAGAALAAAKYIATDALKESIISPEPKLRPSGAKYLNSMAAVNNYKKSGI